MAKKNGQVDKENIDINEQLKKNKKKMMFGIITVGIVFLLVGGFVGMKIMSGKKLEEAQIQKELNETPLKDHPINEKDFGKTYSKDIQKQTYMLKNGAILFEGTIVFYNKQCANLYNGITDIKEQRKAEPVFPEEDSYGDKLMKDAINKYLQSTEKSKLASAEELSKGLTKAINEQFKKEFGHELVKTILITNHVVQ